MKTKMFLLEETRKHILPDYALVQHENIYVKVYIFIHVYVCNSLCTMSLGRPHMIVAKILWGDVTPLENT